MAGTRLASRDTMSSPPATAASVSGSDALTPKSSFSSSFPDASAATVPAATPMIAGVMPFEHDEPQHIRRSRSERGSDPDLAAAAPDDVRQHAVDADRRERQRNDGKETEQDGTEPLERQRRRRARHPSSARPRTGCSGSIARTTPAADCASDIGGTDVRTTNERRLQSRSREYS